jgi:hypothetical protein
MVTRRNAYHNTAASLFGRLFLALSVFMANFSQAEPWQFNATQPPDHADILLIGDSHAVGHFGKHFDALLRQFHDTKVATYAICGSSPGDWMSGMTTPCGYAIKGTRGEEVRGLEAVVPNYLDLVTTHAPRVVIVELGANMLGGSREWIETTSKALAQTITRAGSACFWIGPPQDRTHSKVELATLYEQIGTAVSSDCVLIDSRDSTFFPETGGDGVHFDSLGEEGIRIAETWAQSTFSRLSALLDPQRKSCAFHIPQGNAD